jgi:hypothetical protein
VCEVFYAFIPFVYTLQNRIYHIVFTNIIHWCILKHIPVLYFVIRFDLNPAETLFLVVQFCCWGENRLDSTHSPPSGHIQKHNPSCKLSNIIKAKRIAHHQWQILLRYFWYRKGVNDV